MPWALRNTLFISLFVIIPYVYVCWRLISASKLIWPDYTKWIKLAILVPVIWVNLLPLVLLFYYAKGTLVDEFVYRTQTNGLDYLFLFPFWIGLIILVEVLPYFLLSDLIQPIINLFYPRLKERLRKWAAVFRMVLIAFFAVYVITTSLLDTYHVSESKYEIKINNLPDDLNNLNLALLADLQVDRFTQDYKIDRVKEIINSEKPDLLFFAGDLVTRGTQFIKQGVNAMRDLQAGKERIACLGDHDYWADPREISQDLQLNNWTFLKNAHRLIQFKNSKILVTGLTYIYSQRISAEALDSLLSNAPQADLKILLVHQPAKVILKAAKDFGYDILLAGHTHGGQVVFHPFGYSLTPTRFENKFYSGYYKQDNLNIFVTNGVGLTMMPLRYGAPAEIMNIMLKK